ncbi:hypothetical protein HPP92_006253 [Vanilla planifolia]|uniref:RRM domain-containing protein n=1 Tax=Vanilla planifolia TaxID=51239 RepID=A0A835RR42_VANPL|nr:hypothetical protein HPP92_006253 [Vanilla planifolia]
MGAAVDRGSCSDDRFIHRPPLETEKIESDAAYQRDVKELVEFLSKLNPSAKEFVPSSHGTPPPPAAASPADRKSDSRLSANAPLFVADQICRTPRGNGYAQGWRRCNAKVQKAQKEESIRRTIYVSDIDQYVTEQQLAALFTNCGQVLDCRICGDPRSLLRFAFIEFADEYSAKAALEFGGTMLGFYPVKVLPSKTAILPVNPTFLPQSADEQEMCVRTVYCTNVDNKVTEKELMDVFECICGKVSRLRLFGDHTHPYHKAFVEFAHAEGAIQALRCSGMFVGSLPIRVSPSKTPVRLRNADRSLPH